MISQKARRFDGTRCGRWTAAGGGIAVALLMAFAASAAASTLRAPYRGTVASPTATSYSAGCGTGKITSPIRWSSTTGVLQMSVAASEVVCKKVANPAYDSSESTGATSVELAVPIKFATSGPHSIAATWDVHISTRMTFSPGSCAASTIAPSSYWFCNRNVEWFAGADAHLLDLTNHTIYFGANSRDAFNESYNYTSESSGSWYNFTTDPHFQDYGTGNSTYWINSSRLVASHQYVLELYLYSYVVCELETYHAALTGASSSASIVMNGTVDRATLASISIT